MRSIVRLKFVSIPRSVIRRGFASLSTPAVRLMATYTTDKGRTVKGRGKAKSIVLKSRSGAAPSTKGHNDVDRKTLHAAEPSLSNRSSDRSCTKGLCLRKLYAVKENDSDLPYWTRRCLDCNYNFGRKCNMRKLHLNFECPKKQELILNFGRGPLPREIPDIPKWARRCLECNHLFAACGAQGRCRDCIHPLCQICDQRQLALISSSRKEADGTLICDSCKYPPCDGCGLASRPKRREYSRTIMQQWYCDFCKSSRQCTECLAEKPLENFAAKQNGNVHRRCMQCEYPTCAECGSAAEAVVRQNEKQPDGAFICTPCSYPPCNGCGRRQRPRRREYTMCNMPQWFCDYKTCQTKKNTNTF